jgi:transposase-like protein
VAQHFLLSAASKTLSLKEIYRMSDDEAHAKLVQIRWSETSGEPVCPRCERTKIYSFSNGRTWKCAACRQKFSVTSGTLFHGRKLAYQDYLAAIAHFIHGVTGCSAIHLRREISVSYRTAFVLAHKLREAMGHLIHSGPNLFGEVDIDGAFVGGHSWPRDFHGHSWSGVEEEDHRQYREQERPVSEVARQKKENKSKLCVASAREKAGRTLVWVLAREGDAVELFRRRIARGSIIHADGLREWNVLETHSPMMRVNHSNEWVAEDGSNTNWCESYNSRLKRAQYGVYRNLSGHYCQQYANEIAWREDHRNEHDEFQWRSLIRTALGLKKSQVWCGYWQRGAGDVFAIPGVPEVLDVVPEFADRIMRFVRRRAKRAKPAPFSEAEDPQDGSQS